MILRSERYVIKQIIIHGAQISMNFMIVDGCKSHVMEKTSQKMIYVWAFAFDCYINTLDVLFRA